MTMLECLVLGRIAHGEQLRQVEWRDSWRVRRGGTLVFADDVRLGGDVATLMQRQAIGSGASAVATLLHLAPDAEARLDATRQTLADAPFPCGASAWNGMLVARFAAPDPQALRAYAIRAAIAITDAADAPRLGLLTPSRGSDMHLTPREKDKLLVAMAALVARRRLERGVKLNYPEAVALITDTVVEGARDGRSVAELMAAGAHVLDARSGDGRRRRDDRRRAGRGDVPRRHQARHRARADPRREGSGRARRARSLPPPARSSSTRARRR